MIQQAPRLHDVFEGIARSLRQELQTINRSELISANANVVVRTFVRNAGLPYKELSGLPNRDLEFDGASGLLQAYVGQPGSSTLRLLNQQPIYPKGFSYTLGFNITEIRVGVDEGWIGYPVRDLIAEGACIKTNLLNYIAAVNQDIKGSEQRLAKLLQPIAERAINEAIEASNAEQNIAKKLNIKIK